jgi:hypothetical protein
VKVLSIEEIEKVSGAGFCNGMIVSTFAGDGALIGLGFAGVGALAGAALGAAIGEVASDIACG